MKVKKAKDGNTYMVQQYSTLKVRESVKFYIKKALLTVIGRGHKITLQEYVERKLLEDNDKKIWE